MRFEKGTRKFLQTVGGPTWKILVGKAQKKDISVQELMRVIIIPEWLKGNPDK